MALDLNGTSSIVTGGGSGLGEATARLLAARGAKVVIADLKDDRNVAGDIGGAYVQCDVTNPEQVIQACDTALEMGPLRSLVTAAGIGMATRTIGRDGQYESAHNLDLFKRVIDINLVGTFNMLRLAAVAMLDNEPVDGDRGVVVMTASIAAYDGQVGQAAYAASKGGVVALTLSAARDLADKAVRVVTIAPGTFMTPMLAGLPEEATAALEAQVPHPSRLGRPEEYANLVRHVVDNGMLNGEVIRLDGALRMPPR
jgi:NAD(P)-dependent dehydrogenase (short-subunit alcohol dehydrogenase family)